MNCVMYQPKRGKKPAFWHLIDKYDCFMHDPTMAGSWLYKRIRRFSHVHKILQLTLYIYTDVIQREIVDFGYYKFACTIYIFAYTYIDLIFYFS